MTDEDILRAATHINAKDREYADALLNDLDDDFPTNTEIVAQWFCKVRYEALLAALRASTAPQALAATPAVGGHMHRSELDDASNACLELCSKHGFATGHGDTVADMIREIDGQIAPPASPLRGVIREALFEPDEVNATDNLEGALYDIVRLSEQGKPTDEVCIRTIKRVVRQLMKAELALGAASPPEQPAAAPATVKMFTDTIDAKNARIAELEAALGKSVLAAAPMPWIDAEEGDIS